MLIRSTVKKLLNEYKYLYRIEKINVYMTFIMCYIYSYTINSLNFIFNFIKYFMNLPIINFQSIHKLN